jgi:hypothetical protein
MLWRSMQWMDTCRTPGAYDLQLYAYRLLRRTPAPRVNISLTHLLAKRLLGYLTTTDQGCGECELPYWMSNNVW